MKNLKSEDTIQRRKIKFATIENEIFTLEINDSYYLQI